MPVPFTNREALPISERFIQVVMGRGGKVKLKI